MLAQLKPFDDRGRRIFGQLTIWLLVGIVGGLQPRLCPTLSARLGGPICRPTRRSLRTSPATQRRGPAPRPVPDRQRAAAARPGSVVVDSQDRGLSEPLRGTTMTVRRCSRLPWRARPQLRASQWGIGFLLALAIGLIVAAGGRNTYCGTVLHPRRIATSFLRRPRARPTPPRTSARAVAPRWPSTSRGCPGRLRARPEPRSRRPDRRDRRCARDRVRALAPVDRRRSPRGRRLRRAVIALRVFHRRTRNQPRCAEKRALGR